ncbi:hypothetical protein N177_1544 [Lutibaculum baratangense AMV1]|uniref:Uncharacterized protein n=1 Tax=Lutibaculum baratangense AMV1 TaxID=631454 RepID=V4RHV4_9HYPH|nr:hypothetical protein N177_1544 [Lutibaculum baratangense AMV1]
MFDHRPTAPPGRRDTSNPIDGVGGPRLPIPRVPFGMGRKSGREPPVPVKTQVKWGPLRAG